MQNKFVRAIEKIFQKFSLERFDFITNDCLYYYENTGVDHIIYDGSGIKIILYSFTHKVEISSDSYDLHDSDYEDILFFIESYCYNKIGNNKMRIN